MKKGKMVLIEWVDSNVCHGWIPEGANNGVIAHCRIVGILIMEDATKVVVALGDSDCGSVLETITIPRECIISIKELRVK